ncbi:MAG TPA: hypothetical protein VF507_01725 [Pyrinomonadaceae bacterium]
MTSHDRALRLAAALNEIDEISGTKFNDFQIIEHIRDHGPRYGVDLEAFDAVEVTWPAMVCNQYRFIIPVGTEDERAVVLWNRLTTEWEALSGAFMPSFVARAIQPDGVVATA